jgi:predicted HicB family RNase H-like nuclease
MGSKSRQLHCSLKLRISEREQRAFQEAAELAGLSVSAWVRMVLRERIPHSFSASAPKAAFEGKGLLP